MEKYNGDIINPEYVELLLADIKAGKAPYLDTFEAEDCADYLFVAQRFDDIQILVDHCLVLYPNSPQILFIKAKLLIENDNYKDARHLLDYIAPSFTDDAFFFVSYGWLYLKQEKSALAMECFDKAVQADQAIAYEIAINLNQFGFHNDTVRYMKPYVKKFPDDYEALFELAFAYDKLQMYDDARTTYEIIVDQSPFYAAAWYNLGILYSDISEFDKAIMAYDTAVTVNPEYPEPYYNMGNAYINLAEYEKALDCYTEYASLCDFDQLNTVMPMIGECWWEIGNMDYCRRFYEKAVEYKPDRPELWYGLALSNIELGNHVASLSNLDHAIALDPMAPEYYFARAQAYFQQLMYSEAYEQLILGLQREPEAVLAWFEAFKIWIQKNLDRDPYEFVKIHSVNFSGSWALKFMGCYIDFVGDTLLSAKRARKVIGEIAKTSPDTIYMAYEEPTLKQMLVNPAIKKILLKNNITFFDE